MRPREADLAAAAAEARAPQRVSMEFYLIGGHVIKCRMTDPSLSFHPETGKLVSLTYAHSEPNLPFLNLDSVLAVTAI